ncbi:hypothetical protein BD309DRAFT_985207, partial [Dichomitus squalens]
KCYKLTDKGKVLTGPEGCTPDGLDGPFFPLGRLAICRLPLVLTFFVIEYYQIETQMKLGNGGVSTQPVHQPLSIFGDSSLYIVTCDYLYACQILLYVVWAVPVVTYTALSAYTWIEVDPLWPSSNINYCNEGYSITPQVFA